MCRPSTAIATLAFATAAFAAPGVLDPSFGTYGIAQAPRGAAPVVQPDGRILTGGSDGDHAFVMRLDTRGQPDATFGANGVATVALSTGFASTLSIALQSDGKILAAGETYTAFRLHGMVFVARFNADGSVDTTFGDGGSTTSSVVPPTPPDGNVFYPDYIGHVGVAVGRNDAIFLAAMALRTRGNPVATLVRLDGRGTRDVSFGKVFEDFSRGVMLQPITGPVVQPDDKAVMAGTYYLLSGGTGPLDFAFRLQADGAADPTFGFEGRAAVPLRPSQVLIDAGGRLLVAGTQSGPPELKVARLAPNGAVDLAFGTDGIAAASIGPCGRVILSHNDPCPTSATSIALQPDGRIIQTGVSVDPISSTAIVRFGADGKLDTTFGIDGRVYATLPAGGQASAIDADGARLYVAPLRGYCCGDALSRFLLSPVPISLEASANPAPARAPVTLTATVAGPALGIVSFFDDAGAIAGCTDLAVTSSNASARATCATTLADGTHSVAAAYVDIAGKSRGASDQLILSAGQWPAATVTEFYYAAAGDYFMTSDPAEIAKLDATPGWQRSGETLRAFPSTAPATRRMCRYYTSPAASPRTHFFGAMAAECSLGYPWAYEVDTIAVMTPVSNGRCANGTLPLYRMLDPKGSAHRYSTSASVRESMLAQGWIAEGLGVGVVACMAR